MKSINNPIVSDDFIKSHSICPKNETFIGYKKVSGNVVLKLEIPSDSKCLGGFISRKCRTNKVKVLEAFTIWGHRFKDTIQFNANYDENFKYKIGEIIEVFDFDNNIREECTKGIHFFLTFDEARNYNY